MAKLIAILPGISRVVSNAAPILLLLILSKFIALEELGNLNYFIALITLLGIFTDFGIPEAVQRFLPQAETDREIRKVAGKSLGMEVVIVLLGAGLFFIVDTLASGALSRGFPLLLPGIVIVSAANTFVLVFNGLRRDIRTGFYFSATTISFIAITLFLFFGLNLSASASFLWGRFMSWGIIYLLSLIDLIFRFGIRVDFKAENRFVKFAINSFVFVFAYAVFSQWDSLLVIQRLGESQSGVYRSVFFLASLPNILGVILSTRLLPQYSSWVKYKREKDIFSQNMQLIKYGLILGFIAILISMPLSSLGLEIFYNADVAAKGAHLLTPILIGTVAYLLSSPLIATLQALGKEGFLRKLALIHVSIYVLIPLLFFDALGITLLVVLQILLNLFWVVILFIQSRRYLLEMKRI